MPAKSLAGRLLAGLNRPLRYMGAELVPHWRLDPHLGVPSFVLDGRTLTCFIHAYNCGFPPTWMTERSVELAVADAWLASDASPHVVEIGAVTPYYWPGRVPAVIDPYDPHPLVTVRSSAFQTDLSGSDVLSLSTLEHIGLADYGPTVHGETATTAFDKILKESRRFLVTVPFGVNPEVDHLFFGDQRSGDFSLRYLARSPSSNDWTQVECSKARVPYCRDRSNIGANSIAIVSRPGALCR